MPQNKVIVQEQEGNKVILTDIGRTIQVTTQEIKILSIAEQGPPGAGDKHYIHTQGVPAAVWEVTHNLNKKSVVVVVDSTDTVVIGEVEYLTLNSIRLTFAGSFSGKAYFN